MKRFRLFAICAILAAMALVAVTAYRLNRPTVLTIGIGQQGSEITRLVSSLAQNLTREKASVRIVMRQADSPGEAAKLFETGKVDLAILRNDVSLPSNGRVLAVWQRNPLIMVTPKEANVTRWSQLDGKTVAIVGRFGNNTRLFDLALAQQGIRRDQIKTIEIQPWDIANAAKSGLFQALFLVTPESSKLAQEAINAYATAVTDEELSIIPIREADAISERVTYFDTHEMPSGSLTANPPRPSESIPTIAVTHYLLGSTTQPDEVIAELTRLLFQLRPALAMENPAALRLEAPETDKSSVVPVHPGTLEYLTGNQKSFLDRYSDYIYLTIFMLSLGGSAFAGIAGYMGINFRPRSPPELQEMVYLVNAARQAHDSEALDNIARRADEIFVTTISYAASNNFDEAIFSRLSMALDHLRASIADRRRGLTLRAVMGADADLPHGNVAAQAIALIDMQEKVHLR